ncbi:hypothetical protein [Actinokineospora bangkokensis]|nr:hypothetical protein [Actinokineospora bangkokensis]
MSDERDPKTVEDLAELGYEADSFAWDDPSLCTVCSLTPAPPEQF